MCSYMWHFKCVLILFSREKALTITKFVKVATLWTLDPRHIIDSSSNSVGVWERGRMSSTHEVVVCDNGTGFVKCGFAGEVSCQRYHLIENKIARTPAWVDIRTGMKSCT